MSNILKEKGFIIVSAVAFIGEHSFTYNVGTNRPEGDDFKIINQFTIDTANKISKGDFDDILVKGNFPYKDTHQLPPMTPATSEECNKCMNCVESCPTNTINSNPKIVDETKCIICCACVKDFPLEAKSFENEIILGLVKRLEENFKERREPELFI